jgi:hypothetical protein
LYVYFHVVLRSSNVHHHMIEFLNLQVELTNLMFLPTSNATASQQELLIASKECFICDWLLLYVLVWSDDYWKGFIFITKNSDKEDTLALTYHVCACSSSHITFFIRKYISLLSQKEWRFQMLYGQNINVINRASTGRCFGDCARAWPFWYMEILCALPLIVVLLLMVFYLDTKVLKKHAARTVL